MMDTVKRILTISLLVGLLGGGNAAIADLGLALTPVAGAPTGYRSFDIEATTTTELGVMELVVDSAEAGSIYQVGSPSPVETPGGTYDTYLDIPGVTWTAIGEAADITRGAGTESWDDQDLNKAWVSDQGQDTGPGTFAVGRITVTDWAAVSYTVMGWEYGQTGQGTIASGVIQPAQMGLSVVPVAGAPAGWQSYDFMAEINTQMTVMELLLDMDAAGDIRSVSPGTPDDGSDDFDTYLTVGHPASGEQPGNTDLFGAAVDIAGSSGLQAFTDQNIDIAWGPGPGIAPTHGSYQVARVTVKDTATGTYTFLGYQGGLYDAVEISGTFDGLPTPHNRGDVTEDNFVGADDLVAILTNWGASGAGVTWAMGDCAPWGDGSNPGDDFVGADDYVEVLTNWGADYPTEPVPEPATLGLLLLGGLAELRRRE